MAKVSKKTTDDLKVFLSLAKSVQEMVDAMDEIGKVDDLLASMNRKVSEVKESILTEAAQLESVKKELADSKAKKKELDLAAAVVLKDAGLKAEEIITAAVVDRSLVIKETQEMKEALEKVKLSKQEELKEVQKLVDSKKEELAAFQSKIDASKEALRSLIE
jgi:hypothetical protein